LTYGRGHVELGLSDVVVWRVVSGRLTALSLARLRGLSELLGNGGQGRRIGAEVGLLEGGRLRLLTTHRRLSRRVRLRRRWRQLPGRHVVRSQSRAGRLC